MANNNITLVCDLDGTLIKSDMLFEALVVLIKKKPIYLFFLPIWLLAGKATLKENIFSRVELNPESIPYRDEVVKFLLNEKKKGRQIVLATASHISIAQKIADHFDFFDKVYGTSDKLNLKGKNKAIKLVEEFGEKGFDYIGDNPADLKIWEKANSALVVDLGDGLVNKAEKVTKVSEVFDSNKKSFINLVIKQIRVYQWVKNVLLFLPALGAHIIDINVFSQIIIAFFSFSFLASSVYVANDLLDLESDRAHPRKRKRPFASGDLPIVFGLALGPILFIISYLLAFTFLPIQFVFALSIYYVITTLYSFTLKRKVIIDTLTLASLYTIRIISGGLAVDIPMSPWILAFSMFMFLSLALVKRYTELLVMKSQNKVKASGRGYETDDAVIVLAFGAASGYLSALVFALYSNSDQVTKLYNEPYYFFGISVLILYWITRVWLLAHRGKMTDDPIVFTGKDKTSWVLGLMIATLGVLATV